MINATAQNINKKSAKKRVLVVPLDWGLGHATRCIPVIADFLLQGFEVFLAGENAVAVILKEEFPTLIFLPLRGYRISYGKSRRSLFGKILLQIPRAFLCIKNEKQWLKKMIGLYRIDIVLSDNRFGLYSKNAHCIFMTHQLFIKTGNKFTEKIAQKINYRFINRFDECWVPDYADGENVAGELSHPEKMPKVPVKYIGILSRFSKKPSGNKIDIVALVSGPEPQRSILESILTEQLKTSRLKSVLMRGLPNKTEIQPVSGGLKTINHLPAKQLNDLLLTAGVIICRSGYSTIMDLISLGSSAILIPTPGQTEQEYLGQYLAGKGYFILASQQDFTLSDHLYVSNKTPLKLFQKQEGALSNAIIALQ